MAAIAVKVSGELENLSTLCLYDSYPTGQAMRGAFGYVFLEMGLKLAETYSKNVHHVLYFKDCFVKHEKDGGNLIPTSSVTYRCDKCNQLVPFPVQKDSVIGIHIEHGQDENDKGNDKKNDKVNSFYNEAIVSKNSFNFEVVLNMKAFKEDIGGESDPERRLSDLMSAIRYVESNGINIGKRNTKGFGKMKLKNVKVKEITNRDIEIRSDEIAIVAKDSGGRMTLHLVSDCIAKGSLYGPDILRETKNAAKFFTKRDMGSGYDEPEINVVRNENYLHKTVEFLDHKINPITREGVTTNKYKTDVIARGAKFYCLIDGGKNLENIYGNDKYKKFFDSLAIAEMLRGIGERTPFGKGQFKIV